MSKKKLIIIISLLVILLGGSVAGLQISGIYDFKTLFEEKEEKIVMNKDASFFPMEQFVISLKQPGNARFLMIEMSLMSHDPRMEDQVGNARSIIRNSVLKYFSGKSQSTIQDEVSEIDILQENLKDSILEASETYNQLLPVEKVLLTNIIAQ